MCIDKIESKKESRAAMKDKSEFPMRMVRDQICCWGGTIGYGLLLTGF